MSAIVFTSAQNTAIRTVDRSVLVSAAAGSGKTEVLAERCAYLVCDAPPPFRCNVDELLVLTFTDASAAEMRSRILKAIRKRLQENPDNDRLREQILRLESARISTIHAFCLWLLRRWFSEIGIDPTAALMDAEEAVLLKREVLDALLRQLYQFAIKPGDPLGVHLLGTGFSKATLVDSTPKLAGSWIKLVDDYGLGKDGDIREFILRLYDWLMSLPDPDRWLRDSSESLSVNPQRHVRSLCEGIQREIEWQIEECSNRSKDIQGAGVRTLFYRNLILDYVAILERCKRLYAESGYDSVRSVLHDLKPDASDAPRGKRGEPAESGAESAKEHFLTIRKKLFENRLQRIHGNFTESEWIEGVKATAPYVETICKVIQEFRSAYTSKKRRLNALDFSDLERLAFDLLSDRGDLSQPSNVAKDLQRRFTYVLVDEFQDINPLQEAVIRLLSREDDHDRLANLFAVGDVKQSIYRFRLAEPTMFTSRLERFRAGDPRGKAISLQSNYRSRPGILQAVNCLFGAIMRQELSGITYDRDAELIPARPADTSGPTSANDFGGRVEVHLVERAVNSEEGEDESASEAPPEPGFLTHQDPANWSAIEREAYVIGTRIRECMLAPTGAESTPPLAYRDIAVLLRATRVNAERMAGILTAMGIPAYAQVGGSLFAAIEVRDALAALRILDNPQQDIALAAVLRSGVFGEAFTDDDLALIRCFARNISFHAAVRGYAKEGDSSDLRSKVQRILARIEHYRAHDPTHSVADCLWDLYERRGHLAYTSGLPNGPQRRANLLKLHDLARKFGTFRRQGLRRFLKFVDSLRDNKKEPSAANPLGESEDVVRIMSVHQSKGLEFPVVFLAGLGTKFNLGDRSGRMIFERTAGIGLRVVDPERMIEYPSATHHLAAEETDRNTREEEMRILYVAMTRARDHLVLVGSGKSVSELVGSGPMGVMREPSRLSLAMAQTPLDWLLPTVMAHAGGSIEEMFDVRIHDSRTMTNWSLASFSKVRSDPVRRAVAQCQPLPADEVGAASDKVVEEVLSRIEYVYPHLGSTSVRAVWAAGEFKGAFEYQQNPEVRRDRNNGAGEFLVPPSKYVQRPCGSAADRGLATHRALQYLDYQSAVDRASVESGLQRLVERGRLSQEERGLLDPEGIVWFAGTFLADAIRKIGSAYRREFQFIAKFELGYFDRTLPDVSGDEVLVRGIVDGVLPYADYLDILDFKTDAVPPAEIDQRAAFYAPQMETYARAMTAIWRRRFRSGYLVFLNSHEIRGFPDGLRVDRNAI